MIYSHRALGISYADAIPSQDLEPVDAETIAWDSSTIAEQFSHIRAAQHYGMKLGYKRHYVGGSMIFNEPATLEDVTVSKPQNVHPLTFETLAIAELTHSKQTFFNR